MLLLAAAPLKIVYDAIEGTMSNAGASSQQSFMPPPSYGKSSSKVYTIPKTKSVARDPLIAFKVDQHIHVGPEPILITCPFCFKLITTKINYVKGENRKRRSWVMCCSSSKDVLHYCPKCHNFLGKFAPR